LSLDTFNNTSLTLLCDSSHKAASNMKQL